MFFLNGGKHTTLRTIFAQRIPSRLTLQALVQLCWAGFRFPVTQWCVRRIVRSMIR
jgi:hypothetical protein